MFELIPALDLMNGHVVRARRGERHLYGPLRCRLCQDSDPFVVVEALLTRYSITTVYVADLDAIRGRGGHEVLLRDLCAQHPSLKFWVDQGPIRRPGPWRTVLGSESLTASLCRTLPLGPHAPLLSLDFRGLRLQGPCVLWQRTDLWPRDVIAMQLRRVGSGMGPDLPLLHRLRSHIGRRTGTTRLYAAGGVRDMADLERVRRAGAAGVLVAGILYDTIIDATSLASRIG